MRNVPTRKVGPRAARGRADADADADAVDRHVAARIIERRTGLGLGQRELAGLVGVTAQQIHKYETGANRIAVGRLHAIAGALGVGVGHFFEGLDDGAGNGGGGAGGDAPPSPRRRLLLGLVRDFAAIPRPEDRDALRRLARALADRGPA